MTTEARRALRLAQVVDALGESLVSVVASNGDSAEVTSVVIHDPYDEDDWQPGGLLLAPAVREPAELAGLLERAAQGLAGVVVKAPAGIDAAVRAAARRSGVDVVRLADQASWASLADSVRAVLAAGRLAPAGSQLHGIAAGDLFAVADAVSALLDTSIALEDPSSHVLAWSSRQQEADPARIEGIVGRQAPPWLTQALASRGVFSRLDASTEPVFVESPSPELLPRMAVAVRAGAEVLGYLWASAREPFATDKRQELLDIAKVVAIHLLHYRARLDSHDTLRADLAETVLRGGEDATDAAARLGVAADKLCVLAVQLVGDRSDQDPADLRRVADSLTIHLSAVHPQAAVTVIGEVVYVVLPWPPDTRVAETRSRSLALAKSYLDRVGARLDVVVAVGGVADTLEHAVHARTEADRVLRVLREQPDTRPVATMADVQTTSLLLRVCDLLRKDAQHLTGPVETLQRHDHAHGTEFTESLRAYLDAFGDVRAAAAYMHVHPNTFRYRLRRVGEISGLDLADAEERLQAMLHLRLSELLEPHR